MEGFKARTVASEPEAVEGYLKETAAAGKVPSVRGAVKAAKSAQRTRKPVTPAQAADTDGALERARREDKINALLDKSSSWRKARSTTSTTLAASSKR